MLDLSDPASKKSLSHMCIPYLAQMSQMPTCAEIARSSKGLPLNFVGYCREDAQG